MTRAALRIYETDEKVTGRPLIMATLQAATPQGPAVEWRLLLGVGPHATELIFTTNAGRSTRGLVAGMWRSAAASVPWVPRHARAADLRQHVYDPLVWRDSDSAEEPVLVAEFSYLFEWLRDQLATLPALQGDASYDVPDLAAVGARDNPARSNPVPPVTLRVQHDHHYDPEVIRDYFVETPGVLVSMRLGRTSDGTVGWVRGSAFRDVPSKRGVVKLQFQIHGDLEDDQMKWQRPVYQHGNRAWQFTPDPAALDPLFDWLVALDAQDLAEGTYTVTDAPLHVVAVPASTKRA